MAVPYVWIMPPGRRENVAQNDSNVTKFDLADFLTRLAEAIHGGPAMAPSELATWRAQAALESPFRVVAIHHGSGRSPVLPIRTSGTVLLQVHPGLAYLCTSQPLTTLRTTLAPRHLIVGESREAADETRLVATIQQAIIALRRRELAGIGRRQATTLDAAAEIQARHLAVQALRRGGDTAAVTLWSDIVVLRHQGSLNTVRRKAVELLTELTRECDHANSVGYPFRAAIDRIFHTFALSDLAGVIIESANLVAKAVRTVDQAPPASEPLVLRARELLRQQSRDDVAIADIAAELGVSGAHLSRRFRAVTGMTPIAFLTHVRLEQAKERLRDSDDGLLAIAIASGFVSIEHFHRTFKRATGLTPGRWRWQARGQ